MTIMNARDSEGYLRFQRIGPTKAIMQYCQLKKFPMRTLISTLEMVTSELLIYPAARAFWITAMVLDCPARLSSLVSAAIS